MSSGEGDDDPTTPVDDLEHWLKDVRAELGNDPPGWLAPDSDAGKIAGDTPDDIGDSPENAEFPEPGGRTPPKPGRHRSAD